jgi:hypothetical protein
MNSRTRLVIGALIIGTGAVTLWLASTASQESVRYVEQIVADPSGNTQGSYTLLGVPQPERIPLSGSSGTFLVPNRDWSNETVSERAWSQAGATYSSTLTLTVAAQADGSIAWRLHNETRLANHAALTSPPTDATWRLGTAGQAFQVSSFATAGHQPMRLWAWYDATPENPMQPKPSQFVGHLMTNLPDGSPLPSGALVYEVDQFTAGCSSKFLPPEAQAQYANYTEPA